jgi:hypothetical protein
VATNPLGDCGGCPQQMFVGSNCGEAFYCTDASPDHVGCHLKCPEGEIVEFDLYSREWQCRTMPPNWQCPGDFNIDCPAAAGEDYKIECGCAGELWMSPDCTEVQLLRIIHLNSVCVQLPIFRFRSAMPRRVAAPSIQLIHHVPMARLSWSTCQTESLSTRPAQMPPARPSVPARFTTVATEATAMAMAMAMAMAALAPLERQGSWSLWLRP